MNWTGGRRTGIQASEEKVKQRQFFERQRRQTLDRPTSHPSSEGSHLVRYTSAVYRGSSQAQQQSGRSSSHLSEEVNLKANSHKSSDYNSARLACLDMLRSPSFDWTGDAFHLRSLSEQGHATRRLCTEANKRSREMDEVYENDYLESSKLSRTQSGDSEKQKSDQHMDLTEGTARGDIIFLLDHDDADYANDFSNHREKTQEHENEEQDDEEGEKEPLVVPERHFANCKKYRTRRREEEMNRANNQHVKIKFEVSARVNNMRQLYHVLDTEDDRYQAQEEGLTNVATPLLRAYCSHKLSPRLIDEGGPITLEATPLSMAQRPFRFESTSLATLSTDLLSSTAVRAGPESAEALSVGLRPGASFLPSLDYSSLDDVRDARPSQEKDITLVQDCAPSVEARMDGSALSMMSSVISASPDWPPPNQLAGHQLQVEGIVDDFFEDNAHNEKGGAMMYNLKQNPSLRAGLYTDVAVETDVDRSLVKEKPQSPALLPSDPEDTSVLQPICSLDGTGPFYELPVETSSCSNPSPSEWIGSDDWVEE